MKILMKTPWRLTMLNAVIVAASALMNPARAADSADLVVQATAVTGACTPALDTPVVSFGVIPYGTLDVSAPTALAEKTVQLTINCTSPMAVGWTLTDNRTDSVAQLPVTLAGQQYSGPALAGLGNTPDGAPLGNWALSVGMGTGVQHDGTAGIAIISADGGNTWRGTAGAPAEVSFTGSLITSVADITSALPVPFSTGTFSLTVGAVIAPRSTLNLTDDTRLDGSATISLVYL